jgi:hypothetical protein
MTTHDQQVMAMMLQGQNLGTSQAGGGAGNASDASATGVGNGGSGSGDTPNRAGEGKPVEVPTAAQTMVVPRKRWMKDTIFKSAQLMHVQVIDEFCGLAYICPQCDPKSYFCVFRVYLPGSQRARQDLWRVHYEQGLRNRLCRRGKNPFVVLLYARSIVQSTA